LWNEFTRLHRAMLKIARTDPVCHRLMSAPGVGALVALTYRSAVDDPGRFARSRTVGACFGLTPKNINPARPTSTVASAGSAIPWCAPHFMKL
jgi:transposase